MLDYINILTWQLSVLQMFSLKSISNNYTWDMIWKEYRNIYVHMSYYWQIQLKNLIHCFEVSLLYWVMLFNIWTWSNLEWSDAGKTHPSWTEFGQVMVNPNQRQYEDTRSTVWPADVEREHRREQIIQSLLLSVPVISRGRREEAHDVLLTNVSAWYTVKAQAM